MSANMRNAPKMRATDIPRDGARLKTAPTQKSIKSSFAPGTRYEKTSKKWKDITSANITIKTIENYFSGLCPMKSLTFF